MESLFQLMRLKTPFFETGNRNGKKPIGTGLSEVAEKLILRGKVNAGSKGSLFGVIFMMLFVPGAAFLKLI